MNSPDAFRLLSWSQVVRQQSEGPSFAKLIRFNRRAKVIVQLENLQEYSTVSLCADTDSRHEMKAGKNVSLI